jgi:tetratricopeptide (TPR) repeat protein
MSTALLLATALLFQQTPQTKAAPQDPEPVPLYPNLGSYHHAISTKVPQAQAYFDQGVRLAYAFNHAEAIRAFTEAARLDPKCAICWWGVAYSYGPNINLPMDSAGGVAAWDALQKARALMVGTPLNERAYINALAQRYAANPTADRAKLDSAYSFAMQSVAKQYPTDLDAATLAAEAMMTLRPWNYWQKDGTPYPGTPQLLALLERVIATNPNHPGACHFYIHATEATDASKAIPCAERLASLMPGAGHLVHMPAHTYIRVGRWNDAIEANVHAVHSDQTYIADVKPSGFYPAVYYPHNHHFLAFAATMAGRSKLAIEHARAVRENIPVDVATGVAVLQPWYVFPNLTLVTFGKWEDVLKEPDPPATMQVGSALVAYAKGTAHAAMGHSDVAKMYLDTLNQIAKGINPTAATISSSPINKVVEIAQHSLMGEIAYRGGNLAEAETHFRAAYDMNNSLNYTEPPDWYYPVHHSLGMVLIDAGKAAEAEKVYQDDLKRFPENVWSLKGLALALHAQNKHSEAAAVEGRLHSAMEQSDVTLSKSRF